ncbi:unnamed protein product [Polarella glacialis]|uniref:EamA domain-containing protein n=1 Tax=Polarella glacialis TaxID=89957 RepID=A0A813D5J1_POLGL|nr:unnamed protein product [Polarella glacialis]CAE8651627.1 unnamed protein product [Polarella glacialis]
MPAMERLSGNALGYMYMLISTTSFTGMAAVSKIIGPRASTEEKLLWRSLLSIGFTLLAHFFGGWSWGKATSSGSSEGKRRNELWPGWPKRPWLLALRGLCGHVALLAYLEAIERLPLSEAVFLGKIHPVAAAVLSRILLGEHLSRTRALAIFASLGGVALVANPTWGGLASGSLVGAGLALFAGCLSGAAYCCVRALGRGGEAELWTLLALPLVSVPFCMHAAWERDKLFDGSLSHWFLLLGICTHAGQVFLARGLALLPAASGTQVMYLGTLSGVVMGVLLGQGLPSWQSLVGGVIIIAALPCAEMNFSKVNNSNNSNNNSPSSASTATIPSSASPDLADKQKSV